MKLDVRPATVNDIESFVHWYAAIGEPFPGVRKFPAGSTLVCDLDGVPAITVVVVITNIDVAWLECLIGNPVLKGPGRRLAMKTLVDEACRLAREMNFTDIFCMAPNEKLKAYYEKMGFRVTAQNIFTLIKGL